MHASRRSSSRRRVLLIGGIVLVVAVALYLPITLLAPLRATPGIAVAYTAPQTVPPTIALPGYGASAISAVDYPQVLVTGGSTTPVPIASITKIITALVVLDKAPLSLGQPGPSITFTAADEALRKSYLARNGDVYPIQVGGSQSQLNVMTVALVASANNYSRALADWAYGSEGKFLVVAKSWLKNHGLTSTTLTDSTGLNPQNQSTPTDMIALGKLALANPVVARLVAITKTTLPVVGEIENTNSLLGKVGIDGIKTGTLDRFGASLLFATSFTIGDQRIRLIGVILDGPTHPLIDQEISTLIRTVKSGFHVVTLTRAGERFASYRAPWGSATTAVAAESRSVVVWAGTPVSAAITATGIHPAKKGTLVGTATFTVDGTTVAVPLKLAKTLPDPPFWWRLTNPGILF